MSYCVTFFIFFITNRLDNFCLLRRWMHMNVRVLMKDLITASWTAGNLVASAFNSAATTLFSFCPVVCGLYSACRLANERLTAVMDIRKPFWNGSKVFFPTILTIPATVSCLKCFHYHSNNAFLFLQSWAMVGTSAWGQCIQPNSEGKMISDWLLNFASAPSVLKQCLGSLHLTA